MSKCTILRIMPNQKRVILTGSTQERKALETGRIPLQIQSIGGYRALGILHGLIYQNGVEPYNLCGMTLQEITHLSPVKLVEHPLIGSTINVHSMEHAEAEIVRDAVKARLRNTKVGPTNITEFVRDFCWFPDPNVREAVLERLLECMVTVDNIPQLTKKDVEEEFKGLGMKPIEIRRKLQLAFENAVLEEEEDI